MSWDDIFTNFELRHKFLLDKLQLDYEQNNDEDTEIKSTKAIINQITSELISLKDN